MWSRPQAKKKLSSSPDVYIKLLIFTPLPIELMCHRHYVSGLSVRESFRASVQTYVLFARYVTNQLTKFHQTLVDDVVEGRDVLIRF